MSLLPHQLLSPVVVTIGVATTVAVAVACGGWWLVPVAMAVVVAMAVSGGKEQADIPRDGGLKLIPGRRV